MPRARNRASRQLAFRKRSREVAALVTEDVNLTVVADSDDRHVAEHPAHRCGIRELVLGHQVVPARLHQMRDRFSMVGTARQPE